MRSAEESQEDYRLWQSRSERAKALPVVEKQRFIDLFWSGKTIGECREVLGWDLALACAVMDENIESALYLRKEVRGC